MSLSALYFEYVGIWDKYKIKAPYCSVSYTNHCVWNDCQICCPLAVQLCFSCVCMHSICDTPEHRYIDIYAYMYIYLYIDMLVRPPIYRKTSVQSVADHTVYIRTISGHVDLTCILYIVYFLYSFYNLRVSPNRDEQVGNPHKKCQANLDANRENVQKNIQYTIYMSSQHARWSFEYTL